jgi:hypothetical protein
LDELEPRFPEEISDFRRQPEAITNAGRWVEWLTGLGIGVDVFPSWAAFEAKAIEHAVSASDELAGYGVILLDYRFGDVGDGAVSRGIAEQIANRTRTLVEAGGRVPILVRFSAEAVDRTEADILEFLEGLKFPRSAYAVVPKASIRAPGWDESFLNELEKADTGRRLFALTIATQVVLFRAVQDETDRLLFKLDVPSVRLLNEQALEPEGVAQVEHWLDIITSLLGSSLRESEEVARATGRMLDLMATAAKPGAPSTGPALSRIENRLRFDYAVNRLMRPIDFGDIFEFDVSPDRVALVVTQACDMAIRMDASKDGQRAGIPERPRVMLLIGDLRRDGLPLNKNDEGWTTDFARLRDEEPSYAIEWDLKSTVMLPRAPLDLVSLSSDGHARVSGELPADPAFWSKAFGLYVEALLVAHKGHLDDGVGLPATPIRFSGDGSGSSMPGLGSLAEYSLGAADGGARELGIRRIARLRAVETQRIAHQMSFWSSRVALATQLRTNRIDLMIRLKPLEGHPSAEMPAVGLKTKGDSLPRRIDMATSRFQELCRLLPSFARLGDAAGKVGGESFELKGILDTAEMKPQFVLAANGSGKYDVKEKLLPGDPVPASIAARAPQTRRRSPRNTGQVARSDPGSGGKATAREVS